jgi:hypothetical protein
MMGSGGVLLLMLALPVLVRGGQVTTVTMVTMFCEMTAGVREIPG